MLEVEWSSEAAKRFPNLSLGVAYVEDVEVSKSSKPLLHRIERVVAEVREKYKYTSLKDVEKLKKAREFFWKMDIDPTKHRPAAEALLRRILQGKSLPIILNVVDAYNLVSVESLLTLSAFDWDKVHPPLKVRFARAGEAVELLGRRNITLRSSELVLADSQRVLCVYAHGDVEHSKITARTTKVLVVAYGMPGVQDDELELAVRKAASYITEFTNGKLKWHHIFSMPESL
jgi:DNA/RNA-binding domain of Phe-tRNA-synthetase-like protein